MLVYCDSVILIYLLDHVGTFQVRAASHMANLKAAGDEIAVSDLTRLECRLKPVRLGNAAALALFDGFFSRPDVRLVPFTTAVFDRSTQIRAAHDFKLADALHLGVAAEASCQRFLTNDSRLSAFTDITVEFYRDPTMAILTPQEKEFLDVFFHEATTLPFTGPATKALHGIQIWYHDISWISWAYDKECPVNPTTCAWGHAADVAPPLPWPDRASALRRNEEIQRIAEQRRQPAFAPKAS